MAKQVYIDSNGNEIQVSGTVNSADMMPMSGNDSTKVSEAIGDLSTLTTSVKSSLVGAINEIASYTPVYGNTASGAIETFYTSLALPLQDCTIDINAVQESGTPTPSSPKAISGFTGANIAVYNENLFTSMATSSTDGITTSYDNTTGLISIENNSRTTNYISGSTRAHVATGLNSSHTYKYEIIPNVAGVTLIGDGTTALSKDGFTGYTVADLRITNYYDFVNDHPIGSVTKVRLVLYDVTTGVLNTYPITWQSEAGTVYGGLLDVTSGKLTVTRGYKTVTSNNTIRLFGSLNSNTVRAGVVTSGMKMPTWNNTSEELDIICNIATPNTDALHSSVNAVEGQCCLYKDGSYPLAVFTLPSSCSTANLALTELVNKGCKYCYPLANPTTVQLTPTQISAIVGTNNVFTDTNGNTSVVYACSLKDYIDSQ